MNKKNFNVRNEKYYSLLETKDYGEIVFGCPPGIVKDFLRIKKPLPAQYIIPSKIFCDNLNNFDFEFIVYSFLFSKAPGSTVSVYCLPEQEKRFRTILNETLFGPKFRQLLESQSYKLLNENLLNEESKKNLHKFLIKGLATNKDISLLFDNLVSAHESKLKINNEIKNFIDDEILCKTPLILNNNIKNLSKKLTKIYIQCAQLKKELDLFSLAKEKDRNSFISNLIKFNYINKSNFCILNSVSNKNKKLKIREVEPGIFKIVEKKTEHCAVNLNSTHIKPKTKSLNQIKAPFFGVTFVGVGSGFSHDKENSSLIVWAENKGIMIDVVADNNSVLLNYGINKNNVNHVFLTHVHSDHDAGVLENLLEKRKTYLISSRIIYESFLRKTQALTSLSRNSIERFVEFVEVEPNKKIKIPEFDNTFFEFDYSLHSIPTGRCKITYAKGKIQKTISHSGDTKYDIPKVNAWYAKGAFTQTRKNEILSFIWDADLIIHDVGGGILHTNYESLLNLEKKIKHKTVLVHQNDKPPLKNQLRYVVDGESIALIK